MFYWTIIVGMVCITIIALAVIGSMSNKQEEKDVSVDGKWKERSKREDTRD